MSSDNVPYPLTAAEYDQLDTFLASVPGADAMNLEELDGFFAALICGPELVMASEYLPLVLGDNPEEGSHFATIEDANTILDLLMRHWNHIALSLQRGDIYWPVFYEYEDGITYANDWAVGFSRGVGLRPEGWDELIEDDDMSGWLAPAILLSQEQEPDFEDGPITPEKREDLLALMVAGLPKIYAYFEPQRRAAADWERSSLTVRRLQPKVGRNEPCPCGSGQKYKRCCAQTESVH